jgi:hypothetical protein
VAHACNPSHSGGREQENRGSKPSGANSSRDPISKKPFTKKRTGGVAQGEGPTSNPSTTKRKKKGFVLHLPNVHVPTVLSTV